MNTLIVENVDISYGDNQVVDHASFNLKQGDIGCLLGPSGCGKTTLLQAIAGFQHPTAGQILINDHDVTLIAPERRNVGMVFQDYALFPNLNVADNILFGLDSWSEADKQERLKQLLMMVGLSDLMTFYPHQLSGGQQQRVALARALAPKPTLLLLDEPFSNLDVSLREQLAREVRDILKKEGISAILVTHDQEEAFAMADEISVMNHGRVQQQDSATNLYHHPTNRFVAEFIGEGVFIKGKITEQHSIETEIGSLALESAKSYSALTEVQVLIRPEYVCIASEGVISATITDRIFRGSHYLYELQLESNQRLLSQQSSQQPYEVGSEVKISISTNELMVLSNEY